MVAFRCHQDPSAPRSISLLLALAAACWLPPISAHATAIRPDIVGSDPPSVVAAHSFGAAPPVAAPRRWNAVPEALFSPAPQAPQSVAGPSIWHVVDSSIDPAQRPPILRGTRSLWCGAYSPCWAVPVGYPNLRCEILFVDTGSHVSSYMLNVTMIASAELMYDHLYLIGGGSGATDPIGNSAAIIDAILSDGSSGNSRLLVDWTGTINASSPGAKSIDTTPGAVTIFGSNAGQPDSLTTSITIAAEHRALYFVFRTDELYSSEDGFWPFGNGVLLDDIATSDKGGIYTDAAPAGGADAFGGSVIVGTPGAPIVSSRKAFFGGQPPSITVPANLTVTEGQTVSLTATATDPDLVNIIVMHACGYPAGLTLGHVGSNPASETVSGTIPCGAAAGSPYSILWSATSLFVDVSATTVLTVLPNPHAPAVTAPATITRAIGSIVSFQVLVSDPDGDAITSLSPDLTDLPPGNNAAFLPEPGNHAASFTWTPLSGNEGNYRVGFVASNALQGCASTVINIVPGTTTGVELQAHTPGAPTLSQNRPNPFNPRTSIRLDLPREARVRLDVFDVGGRRVIGLLDRVLPAGASEVPWDGRDEQGRDVPSGIYFYRMEGEGVSLSRRMILLR